jgi:hypothetical protein
VLAALVTSTAVGLGVFIYGPYRENVKRALFLRAPRAGWLFETKEHLAFVVLALVLGAAACALLAPPDRPELRRLSALLFVAAAFSCAIVAAIGTYVASVHGFT